MACREWHPPLGIGHWDLVIPAIVRERVREQCGLGVGGFGWCFDEEVEELD
jgi:hypothetical protein